MLLLAPYGRSAAITLYYILEISAFRIPLFSSLSERPTRFFSIYESPAVCPLKNIVFVIPHLAHFTFHHPRTISDVTSRSERGTHSVCFFCLTQ